MTPSPALTAARRQALIDRTDAATTPGRLQLLDGADVALVDIVLANPCGVVDAAGVTLATTEYAQVTATGVVASIRLVDGDGAWVGDFTAGLSTDDPLPELILPAVTIYAGSFMRLTGSHVSCD